MKTDALLELVGRLPVKPIHQIVATLVERAAAAAPARRPYATLMLRGGGGVSGWIVGGSRDRNGSGVDTVLMQAATANGQPSEEVTYLGLGDIIGVRVDRVATAVECLGYGAVDPSELAEPPTRLDLMRRATALLTEIERAFGGTIKLTLVIAQEQATPGRTLAGLDAWLPAVRECFGALSQDAMARAEIPQTVSEISLVDGEQIAASREGRVLKVVLPCNKPVTRSAAALKAAVEKAL